MKTLFATAIAIVAAILLCAPTTGGQQQQKTKIYVEALGNDAVGVRFAFALKEDINRSSNYQLTGALDHSLRVLLGSRDIRAGHKWKREPPHSCFHGALGGQDEHLFQCSRQWHLLVWN
jgi:hypothetical protein